MREFGGRRWRTDNHASVERQIMDLELTGYPSVTLEGDRFDAFCAAHPLETLDEFMTVDHTGIDGAIAAFLDVYTRESLRVFFDGDVSAVTFQLTW